MEIIFVRHCDPDYEKDSLTPVGIKEAELLSERIKAMNADAFYCSPMGRAQKTAQIALEGTNAEIQTFDWLHEFKGMVWSGFKKHYCWDFLPSEWTNDKRNYTEDWLDSDIMKHGNVKKEYNKVCKGIDGLLEEYGYKHTGNTFEVIKESHDRIVLFCHFGISCVLLGYLLGISPIVLL
nr:histidine phosphatase family protein [Clostridiales bacterium]